MTFTRIFLKIKIDVFENGKYDYHILKKDFDTSFRKGEIIRFKFDVADNIKDFEFKAEITTKPIKRYDNSQIFEEVQAELNLEQKCAESGRDINKNVSGRGDLLNKIKDNLQAEEWTIHTEKVYFV